MYSTGRCPAIRFYYSHRRSPSPKLLLDWAKESGGRVEPVRNASKPLIPCLCAAALLPPDKHELLAESDLIQPVVESDSTLQALYARKARHVDTKRFVDVLEQAYVKKYGELTSRSQLPGNKQQSCSLFSINS